MSCLWRFISIISLKVLLILWPNWSIGQVVKGKVISEDGTPLQFASIFIKESTKGTSANSLGEFKLTLSPGKYELGFHYVGYKEAYQTIDLKDSDTLFLEIILIEHSIKLPELEIRADAEDPAYSIMRKAIARRPLYAQSIRSYSCKAYIKSVFKLIDVPQVLMGERLDELEDWLDAERNGIIYLSESENLIYYEAPNKRKEVMISSKVSGNSQGFSFNRFGIVDLYSGSINIGRPIVNPLESNAFSYYKFKLHGSFYNEDRLQINKIEVIPKREDDAVFSGFLYIIDGEWLLQSADLKLSRRNTKIDLLDTISIQQVYVRTQKKFFPLVQQNLSFQGNILGIKFAAQIQAITTDYEINRAFDPGFFSREIVKIEPLSNQKDEQFWIQNRPIPLTNQELLDYQKKDSIQEVRSSKSYQDSLDRINNRFKTIHLFSGYTYKNTYLNRSLKMKPQTDFYNPVQGWTLGCNMTYTQGYKTRKVQKWNIGADLMYGFADKTLRYAGFGDIRLRGVREASIKWRGGQEVKDINPNNLLSRFFNAYIIWTQNLSISKFYQSSYAEIQYDQRFGVGHSLNIGLKSEHRGILSNRSQYIFRPREVPLAPNDDFKNPVFADLLGNNVVSGIDISIDLRPGSRYISYPDRRFYTRSRYPTIRLAHKSYLVHSHQDFHFSSLSIFKRNMVNTVYGRWNFHLQAAKFWKSPQFYWDFYHFMTAESAWVQNDNYFRGFQTLPLYQYSTSEYFVCTQTEWNDQSYVFDKIPWINKLGFSLVAGTAILHTPDLPFYQEIYLGIDNIGYKLLRLFRANVVSNFYNGRYYQTAMTFSMIISL